MKQVCWLCKGTGELKGAVQAWGEPDAPIIYCERCKGTGESPQFERSEQVYKALQRAAQQIGLNTYKAQVAAHMKAGRRLSTFHFAPTDSQRSLISAMVDPFLSDEEVMGLLWQHDCMKERLGRSL